MQDTKVKQSNEILHQVNGAGTCTNKQVCLCLSTKPTADQWHEVVLCLRLVSEQKTNKEEFRCWPHEKWNESVIFSSSFFALKSQGAIATQARWCS